MSFSFCKEFGKDKVIFVTKEDHATPSTIELPAPEPAEGVITKDGKINWSCPCLGGMATGPCGVDFREAFSCFQYSTADPKGSDCFEAFTKMRDCFQQYPTVYNKANGGVDDDDDDPLADALPAETSTGVPAKEEAQSNDTGASDPPAKEPPQNSSAVEKIQ
ncbi:mitochondrial intermembrane space import and assembly protein 40 [Drosophila guanche]|uniref:Blast:Mitochondrial intermembrane space import and assembly protein 40 n=1 Tax=Drosophila guanche TaxID=7266 RepID=A0A3B0JEZ7_DROGU|nr:mitochondrial intermembrane space import and assembly protein 40 [Drosophila guanche]SPP80954.1 blast:Mitochondrial intermembrane space import and assembly protein 40 [Drosophila guanche]